jgi:hypothetical protein
MGTFNPDHDEEKFFGDLYRRCRAKEDKAAAIETNFDEVIDGIRPRIVLLIMPRDVGSGPDAPKGHAALWTLADIVAEWSDGKWHIVKRRL